MCLYQNHKISQKYLEGELLHEMSTTEEGQPFDFVVRNDLYDEDDFHSDSEDAKFVRCTITISRRLLEQLANRVPRVELVGLEPRERVTLSFSDKSELVVSLKNKPNIPVGALE